MIAFLITYSLAGSQFPRQFPGWSVDQYWVVAGTTALLFFASVLAHELSHAIVARRFGLKVEGITLFIFGGATRIDAESRTPREEALIAVAGPATSLAIGAVLVLADAVVAQPHIGAPSAGRLHQPRLGAFNLILASLWTAARPGRSSGGCAEIGSWPRGMPPPSGAPSHTCSSPSASSIALQPGAIFSGIWLALIGWFLSNAAEATACRPASSRSLSGMRVRDAMDAAPPAVAPNDSVATLVRERMARRADRPRPTRGWGPFAGVVSLRDVRRLPREQWDVARA